MNSRRPLRRVEARWPAEAIDRFVAKFVAALPPDRGAINLRRVVAETGLPASAVRRIVTLAQARGLVRCEGLMVRRTADAAVFPPREPRR